MTHCANEMLYIVSFLYICQKLIQKTITKTSCLSELFTLHRVNRMNTRRRVHLKMRRTHIGERTQINFKSCQTHNLDQHQFAPQEFQKGFQQDLAEPYLIHVWPTTKQTPEDHRTNLVVYLPAKIKKIFVMKTRKGPKNE